MGKYMKKSKTTGGVAVVDLTLGVRTRAKTLALQRRRSPPYLLRSRRHLLTPPPPPPHRPSTKHLPNPSPCANPNHPARNNRAANANGPDKAGPRTRGPSGKSGPGRAESAAGPGKEEEGKEGGVGEEEGNDLGLEGSFGDNGLEFDSRERTARESTPSNLIRDLESVQTPGSTTRPTSSTEAERRIQTRRSIPSTGDLDGFFAKAEEEQLQAFIEKYNFDPVEERPLPGRFEWEKVDP